MSKVLTYCRIVVLFYVLFAGQSFAGAVYNEWAIPKFDGRDWTARQIATSPESIVTITYLLKSESNNAWTEAVQTKFYPVSPSREVLAFFHDYYRDTVLKGCTETEWTDRLSTDSEILSSWSDANCSTKNKTGRTIANFVLGKRGVHILFYCSKDNKVFEKQLPVWMELLRQATIFTPSPTDTIFHTGLLSDTSKMVYIEYHLNSPSYKANTFITTPRKLWRSGRKYMRSEESPDADNHLQLLAICNEPDLWSINLMNNTGAHIVDHGPTTNTIFPVFDFIGESNIAELEFGTEAAFLQYFGCRKLKDETVNSVVCEVFELPRMNYIFWFYIRKDTGLPYKIEQLKNNVLYVTWYDKYTTGIEIDKKLFQPPGNVVFEEH